MSKKVSFVLFTAVFFTYPSLVHAENFKKNLVKNSSLSRTGDDNNNSAYKTIHQWQYIAGGVLGTYPFPGFGIGHAIQGRWTKTGWIHTVLQLSLGVALSYVSYKRLEPLFEALPGLLTSVITLGITGKMPDISDMGSPPRSEEIERTLDILFWSVFTALLVAKTWEAIDVWTLPSSVRITAGQKKLQLAPSFFSYKNEVFPGLGFKYSF